MPAASLPGTGTVINHRNVFQMVPAQAWLSSGRRLAACNALTACESQGLTACDGANTVVHKPNGAPSGFEL